MSRPIKTLVVEDHDKLRAQLVELLEDAGHAVDAVGDGLSALRAAERGRYRVVLLDLMLPGRDGIEVCRRIRERDDDVIVLILTAKGSEDDKVLGLEAGADDYLTKPFGARELLARIEAVSRRALRRAPRLRVVEIDGCRLDLETLEARRGTAVARLTAREGEIVRLLHHHRGRAVSRAELLEEVWRADGDMLTRTVDVTIAKLRQKIERDPGTPAVIRTVKGVGYLWPDPESER